MTAADRLAILLAMLLLLAFLFDTAQLYFHAWERL